MSGYFLFFKQRLVGEIREESFHIFIDAKNVSFLSPSIKNGDLTHFLENLLPEGYELKKIAAATKASESDKFSLVCKYGEDMPGAVRILSETKSSINFFACGSYEIIDESYIKDRIEQEDNASFEEAVDELNRRHETRISLPGAQGKFGIAVFDQQYFKPLDGALSTHIVKYDSNPSYVGVTLNEFICLSIAKRVGLVIPDFDYLDSCGALIISRYDRMVKSEQQVDLLHQIDFCQALNIPSSRKYQILPSDIGIKDMLSFMEKYSSDHLKDKSDLFKSVLFSFLIGNRDNHLKNYSLLYEGNSVSLSPNYDIICTEVYHNLSKDMALHVGGYKFPDFVGMISFSEEFDIPLKILSKKINNMIDKIDEIIFDESFVSMIKSKCPTDGVEMLKKISSIYRLNKNNMTQLASVHKKSVSGKDKALENSDFLLDDLVLEAKQFLSHSDIKDKQSRKKLQDIAQRVLVRINTLYEKNDVGKNYIDLCNLHNLVINALAISNDHNFE